MNSETAKYRKLPGKSRAQFGLMTYERQELHLASDHLVMVRNNYYSETWRKFYLRDVQALVMSHTNAGRNLSYGLGAVAGGLLLMGLLLSIPTNAVVGAVFTVLALIVGAFLVGNLMAGPTCLTTLHTAVQAERLVSLSRIKHAEAALAILGPAITAAQGSVGAGQLTEETPAGQMTSASAHARAPGFTPATAPESEPVRHEPGKYHEVLFFTVGLLGLSALIDSVFQHPAKNMLDAVLWLAVFGLVVVALVKQHRTDLSGALKALPWIALGASIFFLVIGQVLLMAAWFEDPGAIKGGFTNLKLESPAAKVFFIFEAAVYFFLAFRGLSALRTFRNAYDEFVKRHQAGPAGGGP